MTLTGKDTNFAFFNISVVNKIEQFIMTIYINRQKLLIDLWVIYFVQNLSVYKVIHVEIK